jgi:predicted GIY-YIG superfamily endonuclease
MAGNEQVTEAERANLLSSAEGEWYRGVQAYMVRWIAEHKDGRRDTWTSSSGERATLNEQGVWQ